MPRPSGANQGGCGKFGIWEIERMAQAKLADNSTVMEIGSARVMQAGFAALLGLALFIGVAFSHPAAIHNAAHDSRHGIAAPCH
jgi:cobalt transporter subunit CbtB